MHITRDGWVRDLVRKAMRSAGIGPVALVRGCSDAASCAFNRGVLMAEEGLDSVAADAYEEAVELGHSEFSAMAAFNMGHLLQDDPVAAGMAYLRAMATRHPDVAPRAAFNLARLLEHRGEVLGAQLAYGQAVGFGHADVTSKADTELRRLRANDRIASTF